MAGCWNGFTAFNGSLSRNTIETPACNPNNPDLDTHTKCVQAAVASFRAWLKKVQLAPENYGFSAKPINYAAAASELIEAFFPLEGSRPKRFSTGPGAAGHRTIAPIMVPFVGNGEDNLIGIADCTAALGYLFSVVSVPAQYQPATWDDYYFPLTVLYAWCAYLSFIYYPPGKILDIESVPAMTCAMYLIRPSADPIFFLGSTKARAFINAADAANDTYDNLVCLHYRASQIQRAAQVCGGGPLPSIAPLLRRAMIEGLFENLEGDGKYWPKVFTNLEFQGVAVPSFWHLQQALVQAMEVEYTAAHIVIPWNTGPNAHKNIPPGFRLENPLTAPQMDLAVSNLVDLYLANGQPEQLRACWIQVLKLYIEPALPIPGALAVPSMPPAPPGVVIPPAPPFVPAGLAAILPTVTGAVQALVEGLYDTQNMILNNALAKVVRLCRAIKDNTLSPAAAALEQKQMNKLRKNVREDYGRCAETLPAYTVSQVFFGDNNPDIADRIATAADGPNIRGWAMETRGVGKCAVEFAVFADNFDRITLDFCSTVMDSSIYRLPCAEYCKPMLRHVQRRTTGQEEDAYNTAMRAVIPLTYPFPPA